VAVWSAVDVSNQNREFVRDVRRALNIIKIKLNKVNASNYARVM